MQGLPGESSARGLPPRFHLVVPPPGDAITSPPLSPLAWVGRREFHKNRSDAALSAIEIAGAYALADTVNIVATQAASFTNSMRVEAVQARIPCNLCDSEARAPFCPENGLGLVQCQNCGLVYVSPRPEAHELYAIYGESYFKNDNSGVVGYTNYLRDEANIRKTVVGRLKRIERWRRPPGRALDVGCAAGFFLSEAEACGWQVSGIDVSTYAVDYARQRFGFDLQIGSLLEADYAPESFDLVSMWDVIEHVPDPKRYIEAAAQLLKPGGVLVLSTPDVRSLPARMTGRRWVGYKLSAEHIFYFSAATLSCMLDSAGLEIVEHRHIGKFITMRLFLDRLGMYSPLLARVLTVFERAFHLSERALYINPFDIMCITARKR
ncbi:MAG: class I SAM-dependent methyltransferase [Anaerolineae bacterium]|nr:class I SAM-dependent methyltransferase [Anaerolineae bacterium]